METCANCGLEGQSSRFCVRCGAPLTPEPTLVRLPPVPSGPIPQQGPGPQQPGPQQPGPQGPGWAPVPSQPMPMPSGVPPFAPPPKQRSALPWVMGGLVLLLIAGLVGGLFLLRSGGDEPAAGGSTTADSENESTEGAASDPDDEESTSSDADEVINDPLGLGRDMVNQDCTGQYVVMLASSGVPKDYVSTLAPALKAAPTAHYLITNKSCSAFNQEYEGNPIYAAYAGPYDFETACTQRTVLAYRGAYVRELDAGTDGRSSCGCVVGSPRPVVSRTIGESSITASFAVQDVQILLAEAGYNRDREVDGIFGPITERWVRRAQRDNGLEDDGIVGPETWDALAAYCP